MRRVVCAANLLDGAHLLLGARHWDKLMRSQLGYYEEHVGIAREEEQGFIDQWGVFMSRTEAWQVAVAAGQILKRCGGDDANGGTLYSENLY